jgi:hypothetical protein
LRIGLLTAHQREGTRMNKLSAYAKGVLGYVLPPLLIMVNDLFAGDSPWPQTQAEWLQYILSSLVVGTAVVATPNTTTDPVVAAKQSVRLKPGRHALPD